MQREATMSREAAHRAPAHGTLSPAPAGGRTGAAGWSASDLESFLVDAVARELGRRFGGNAVLDRLEAAALLARHVAFESSPERAPHGPPARAGLPSRHATPTEEGIHR